MDLIILHGYASTYILGRLILSLSFIYSFQLFSFQGNIAVPLKNETGTGNLLVIPLFGLVISFIIFWVIRSQPNISMIKAYQSGVTDSSANGLTNLSVFMAMVIVFLMLEVTFISRYVSRGGCYFLFQTILISSVFQKLLYIYMNQE